MPKVTIYAPNGKVSVREIPAGALLLHALGGGVETPCGGHGRCGKCRVTVQGRVSPAGPQETALLGPRALQEGFRLACLATVEGDCTVVLDASRAVQAISGDGAMPAFTPAPIFEKYGAAVDIGTTTLAARQMDALLTHLNRSFDLSGCAEYCIEAGRPDTIDREKLQVLLDHGVDRISVNPQSLEDHVLTAIGRRHTARDVEEAMALATGMGFPHVNMDLIAGLPEDTPEGFRRTLDKCLSYGADNITVHTLSLKKGSRILLENFTIPSAEAVGEMLDYANAALRQADFRPYYLYRQKYMSGSFENTGWCISGAEGLYNIYIMEELHSILSLGAGGSTKMVDPVHQRIERVFHTKYPTEYIQRSEKLEENLSAFRQFHENMRG